MSGAKSQSAQPIGRWSLPPSGTVFSGKRYTPSSVNLIFKKLQTRVQPFHGVMVAEAGVRRFFLAIVDNEPYAAGEEQHGIFVPLTLHGFFAALHHLSAPAMTLLGTDPVYLKCLLTLIQRAPTTEGTTELIEITGVVDHLKKQNRDQLLVVSHRSEMSLFYCRSGELIAGYFADPAFEAGGDSVEERLLAYVYRRAADHPLALHVFSDMSALPAEDSTFERGKWPDDLVEHFLRPVPHLIIIGSDGTIRRHELQTPVVTLGRSDENDLVVDDPAISRRHLIFRREGETFSVEDCGSRNGTLYNGLPLTRITLHQGTELQIGACLIRFFGGDRAAPNATPVLPSEETICRPANELRAAPPKDSPSPTFCLEVVAPDGTRRRVSLTRQRVTFGRSKADVVIVDNRVSRLHGEIQWSPEGFTYRDTGSTNGSLLNGRSVTSAILKPGDVLRLGETMLTFIEEHAA